MINKNIYVNLVILNVPRLNVPFPSKSSSIKTLVRLKGNVIV